MMCDGGPRELIDARYVLKSIEECKRLFRRAPTDRAGHSGVNVSKLRKLGVYG